MSKRGEGLKRIYKKIPGRCITFGVSFCPAQIRQKASRLVSHNEKTAPNNIRDFGFTLFGDASE